MMDKFQIVNCVDCGIDLDEASDTVHYDHDNKPRCVGCWLVRRIVFKARDLSIGISKCESPEEMARCFNYIQKDAEELGRFVTELQSEVSPEAKNV